MRRPLPGLLVRVVAAGALALGVVTAGVVAGAGRASAAEVDVDAEHGGATATLQGLRTFDRAVVHEHGESHSVSAGLFEMSVDDGGTLQTYCADLGNPAQDQGRYEEAAWSASSLHDNRNAGRIRWILQHSYPQVDDLEALAKTAGAGRLTPRTAAAGTQVAIWRFSDKADVEAVDPAAERLADFLQKSARSLPEPRASLSLEPADGSGEAGDRLGPVTVRTSAPSVAVSLDTGAEAAGVRVVDAAGRPVHAARNGTRLYLDVPDGRKPGSASLTAQAAAKVPVGRVLTGLGAGMSQTQVLAGASQSTVSAATTLDWADGRVTPTVTARKDCARGGVDVAVRNRGTDPFRFVLAGAPHEAAPGGSATAVVPVREDQAYRIPVAGPHGTARTFTGVLDCRTATAVGGDDQSDVAAQTRTATVGGTEAQAAGGTGGDLAETGSSGGTTLFVSIAVGFVVVGVIAVLAVRRPQSTPPTGG